MARIHDTVWALDFGTNPFSSFDGNASWKSSATAPLYRDCLTIVSNTAAWHAGTVTAIGNLRMIAGKWVTLRCFTKADALLANAKIFIDYTSATTTDTYLAVDIPSGTRDWTEYSQEIKLPSDADITRIRFVVNPNSGTISFMGLRFTALLQYPAMPPVPADAPPGFGLRGLHVGGTFRDIPGAYSRLRTRWNANLVRFGLEHAEYTDNPIITDFTSMAQYDAWITARIPSLDACLVNAKANNVKVILDYHTMPGGNNRTPQSNLMVEYSGVYWERYIYWWKFLANRYKGNDAIHAFDLMNEPADAWNPRSHGPAEKTWWDCQIDAATEIRKIDPSRTLIFETNNYASCYRFEGLAKFPFANAYPSVHLYEPTEFAANAATTTYPGLIVNGQVVNKQWLKNMLQPLRDYQLQCGYPSVFVGEFSTLRWKNGVAQWLADFTSIFNEWNWDWTYFNYGDPDQYGSQGWSDVDLDLENRQDLAVVASTPTDRAQAIFNAMAGNTNQYL